MISWTGEERQELELSGLLHLRNWKTKLLVIVPCLSDVGMKNSLRLHILPIAVDWSVFLIGWVFKVKVLCNLLCNSTSPACLVQHWFPRRFFKFPQQASHSFGRREQAGAPVTLPFVKHSAPKIQEGETHKSKNFSERKSFPLPFAERKQAC